jgi:putative transposase
LVEKKTAELNIEVKRALIDRGHNELTIAHQCDLLQIPRSTLYYQPNIDESFNLEVMRAIDEIFTDNPEYGSRRIRVLLKRRGYNIGRQLIMSLMRKMGIEAIYPKPNLSKPSPGHKIYPYLLRGIKIERANQVWSTDITYIRMRGGFLYLTAVIDWFSRYVLSWRLSNNLDGLFCREALMEALNIGVPEIFNTDQGSQYTSESFIGILLAQGVKPSMDGRGRALDNVFVERLWRSVKYENIFLNDYKDGLELYHGLQRYFKHYNESRPHMSLNYESPVNIYRKG